MTVHFRVKFTLNDTPRTALLTDRGWTVIHDAGPIAQILNHISWQPDSPDYNRTAGFIATLLRGTVEPA